MKPGELPEGTQAALDHLLRIAHEEGVTIAGFAFKQEPMAFCNFGNCSDMGDVRVYKLLCGITEQKKAIGEVVTKRMERVA